VCVTIFSTGGKFRCFDFYVVTRSYSSHPFLCALDGIQWGSLQLHAVYKKPYLLKVTRESVSGTPSMAKIVHVVNYRIIMCAKLSMLQVMRAASECAMRLKVV